MPQQLIKVRPTKTELIKLKRRLSLAKRVQKIVRDRLFILMIEFVETVRESVETRRRMQAGFSEAYKALSIAAGYHGYIALEKELLATEGDLKIVAGSRNIAGVRLPSFELMRAERAMRGYSFFDTSSCVDRAAQLAEGCLEPIAELAELQRSLELLGREIERTKRISNALEYVVIPALQATMKYLIMKFEERDREEKTRLKRIKVLLHQE